jgi:hypothetical protein
MKRGRKPNRKAPEGQLLDAGKVVLAGGATLAADAGRMIDAGQAILAGSTTLATNARRQGRVKTRERAVDGFEKHFVDMLPVPMGQIVADCARAGIRRGGRSGAILSHAEELARATAMKEAPELVKRFRAEARAIGRRNPRRWAREETAKVLQQRITELGGKPPAVKTIMGWKF